MLGTRSQSQRSHGSLDGVAAAPMAQTTAGTLALTTPGIGSANMAADGVYNPTSGIKAALAQT